MLAEAGASADEALRGHRLAHRRAKEHGGVELATVLRRGGGLEGEFAALGPVLVLDSPERGLPRRAGRALRRALGGASRHPPFLDRLASLDLDRFDLVFANTAANGGLCRSLALAAALLPPRSEPPHPGSRSSRASAPRS